VKQSYYGLILFILIKYKWIWPHVIELIALVDTNKQYFWIFVFKKKYNL